MKRYLKYLLSLFALVILVTGVQVSTVNAEGTQVNGNSGHDDGRPPTSNIGKGGISQFKSGVLCYVTTRSMYTVSDVRFIPYNSIPNYDNINTDWLRPREHFRNKPLIKCPFTLRDVIKSYSGIDWNVPPISITTGNGIGASLRNHLLTVPDPSHPNRTYAMYFVEKVFSEDVLRTITANPDEYYIIIETVIWHGQTKDSAQNFAVTTPEICNAFGISTTRFGFTTDTRNLPHSMFLNQNWDDIMRAVTPNPNGRESLDELTDGTTGFGIMMVKLPSADNTAPPPETPPAITVSASDDYLRANELNYIFPDLKRDSSAMRADDTYDNFINMGITSNWKKHTGGNDRNNKVSGGAWYIDESITSDIVNKLGLGNGLFYRSGAGQYFNPSDAVGLKTINCGATPDGSGQNQYVGYGYNLTRTVFGDNLVISDFTSRGDNQSMLGYVRDVLKFAVGHDSVASNIVMTENVESQTGNSARDEYSFTGRVTEEYEHNYPIHHDASYESYTDPETGATHQHKTHDAWDEDHWVGESEEHTGDTVQYTVTHGLYKYTPYSTSLTPNASAGNLLLASGHIGQAYSKVSFASQQAGQLSIYPEVKYDMWYTPSSETWSTPQKKTIYALGEKKRSCMPGIIHGYNVYIPGGTMKGKTFVDSPLTGTLASDFSNSWAADGSYQSEYEVCTQGSGFETSTINAPKIDFVSFGLDLSETAINGFTPKSSWDSADPASSHMEFVTAVTDSLDSEVVMRRFNHSNAPQGSDYNMSFDVSDTQIGATQKSQIKIVFENGQVTTGKAEVINAIASAYGVSNGEATTIWNNSGIEQQIKEMLVTSASANNHSGGVAETPDKWYDETSECMTITVLKTTVSYGNILLSDKHDYGSSSSQDERNVATAGSGGFQCRYFYTLKFNTDSINVDGYNMDVSGVKYLIHENEIKGARFLVSNATTSNMKK